MLVTSNKDLVYTCDLFGALSQSCSAQGAGIVTTDKRYGLPC